MPGAEWFTSYDFESVDASAAAPPVRSAVSRWRTCMGEQGFDYDTRLAAIEDPSWNLDAKRVTSREIEVAVADVGCKRESDLIAVRAAAERRFQQDLIARQPGRFRELERDLERYRHNAGEALNGG